VDFYNIFKTIEPKDRKIEKSCVLQCAAHRQSSSENY